MLDLWAFWGEQMAWEGLILERNAKKKEIKKERKKPMHMYTKPKTYRSHFQENIAST